MPQAFLIWKQERENYNTEKTHDKTVGPQVQKLKEIRPFPKCMMEEKKGNFAKVPLEQKQRFL